MTNDTIIQVVIIVFLIIMSAYFSATETAFSSLNRTRMKTLAEKGDNKAILALKLSDSYDKLLSTILIGNNIVNIGMASLGTVLFVRLYGDIGATISTIVITVVVLIFGEITPKSIAKDCPEQFAMFSSPFINSLIYILTPLNFLFSMWKKLVAKVLNLESDTKMSQEELLMLVEEVQQDGSIDKKEGELLRNAIEFTERDAEDILTHRVDMEAVPLDSTKEEIAKIFAESKYSRILVYEEDVDHIVGVIHLKDFYTESGITDKPIEEIMTPPIFIMKNEKINSILLKLQKAKSHLTVVIDEYGGTYGIVTMEDILEELVGEIWDEHDEENEVYHKVSPNTYTVDGSTDMVDFCELFHLDVETEAVSLSGWLMEQLGKIPEVNDAIDYENLSLKVLLTDNHRASLVEVKKEILPNQ